MKPLLASALLCLATLLLARPAGAQSPSLVSSAASLPSTHSTVVLGPGGRVLSVARSALGSPAPLTTNCWDNSNTPPVAGAFLPGDEIVDWGIKACLMTGVVRSFNIAYQTSALDRSAGGAGASISLAFYEGTGGNGVLGLQSARYDLTGLPGSTTAGASSNHTVEIDLGNYPFCLADGQIGFGFTSLDGVTMPLLTLAPNQTLGTTNQLDLYSPGPASAASFAGSFDFGLGMPFASLYLSIVEDAGTILASSTVVNGSGSNPLVFSEISPAVLGTTWLTRVDLTNFPTANFTALVLSSQPALSLQTGFGELLVNLTDPGAIANLSFGIHALVVPKDAFILGRTFHSQAAIFRPSTSAQLTNGIDVIPGF